MIADPRALLVHLARSFALALLLTALCAVIVYCCVAYSAFAVAMLFTGIGYVIGACSRAPSGESERRAEPIVLAPLAVPTAWRNAKWSNAKGHVRYPGELN